MDGQRPNEELSEAANLSRVLKFRQPGEEDREFAVDFINSPTGTSSVTVVRSTSSSDGHDQRRLREKKDWDELFRTLTPRVKSEKPDIFPNINSSGHSKLILVMVRPDERPSEKTRGLETQTPYSRSLGPADQRSPATGSQTLTSRFFSCFRRSWAVAVSFLDGQFMKRPKQEANIERVQEKVAEVSALVPSPGREKQRLRNIPCSLATFRFIVQRMSIHSWIIRLINRANVPAFERTITEMPLYSRAGDNLGAHKAILYNLRTSNEWADDLALSITHFPAQRLTFAMLIGASETQERTILRRLRRAEADTAHPMLLPGIVAELERIRQMSEVEEVMNVLGEQQFRISRETVTSWEQSSEAKSERNRKKTEAWLNASFSKNILLTTATMLFSMLRHLDEFLILTNPASAGRRHYQPIHPEFRGFRPGTPQSLGSTGSTVYNFVPHTHAAPASEYLTGLEVLTSEPDNIHDAEAKYQDALLQASMRMKDRLTSIIAEYDEKIRTCTTEVDGMAIATQWSQGGINMEIATASGEDSRQMRAIALVTMVFLPGTFFASMFSMTFFNWNAGSSNDGNQPVVSGSIWIYVLVTVFFTITTLLLFWYFILSRQKRNRARALEAASTV